MKMRPNQALWRGRQGKLWRVADRIEDAASAIRYADKPADLIYGVHLLIDLANLTRDVRSDWLAETLMLDSRDQGRWPKV